jgi:hypothetical protein
MASITGSARRGAWTVLLLFSVLVPPATVASASVQPDQRLRDLESFIHFVIVGRGDLAAAAGQSLLESGVTPAQLAGLVDENDLGGRLDAALIGGRRLQGAEPIVGALAVMVEQGRLDLATNPDRIAEAIELLRGTVRGRIMGRDRLERAGEFAVRPLLEIIVRGDDPALVAEAEAILVERIRGGAVLPICAALPGLDPASQERACLILASIGDPTARAALPFLAELASAPSTSGPTREIAQLAAARIGGRADNAAARFTALADRFFRGDESLVTLPPGQSVATVDRISVWTYDAFAGLAPVPVPTAIWFDVMAMRMARRALELEPEDRQALALFVAADLRRDLAISATGVEDPFFAEALYSPRFFATAAGPSTGQAVLALALDTKDVPLIRAAIGALAQTAGATTLVQAGGRQPLIECLSFPSRRVQIEAALTLANAGLRTAFPSDHAVVPLLASAVRTDAVFAAVVAADAEERRQVGGVLSQLGYTLLGSGATFAEIEPAVLANVGVDLIVVRGNAASIDAATTAVRGIALTNATPLVAVASVFEADRVRDRLRDDAAAMVWTAGAPSEQLMGEISAFMTRVVGSPMDEAEALIYAVDALDALRGLAISNSQVFPIVDALRPLLEALRAESGSLRTMVAGVVALIDGSIAQRSLIDVALDEVGSDQVALLDAAAASARRFGNLAEARQIARLQGLLTSGDATVAEAAGRLYGSLDLSPEEAVRLIIQ